MDTWDADAAASHPPVVFDSYLHVVFSYHVRSSLKRVPSAAHPPSHTRSSKAFSPKMPTPLSLPESFSDSCRKFSSYPYNLMNAQKYAPSLLAVHKGRLADGAGIQFENEDMLKIPVRDINDNGTAPKRNLISIDILRDWIGDTFEPAATNLTGGNGHVATKPDPRCRFIFLITPSSQRPLETTKPALLRILTYHQVMPSLLEFLHAYGSESGKREVRFSGFRTEIDRGNSATAIHSLGRSSDRFQVVYNLKAVSYDPELSETNRLVIRQATIYHQFDIGTGKQMWIIGDPSAKLKSITDSKYGAKSNNQTQFEDPFKASIDIHLMWTTWVISEWPLIIQILDKKVDELSIASTIYPSKEVARRIEAYQRLVKETAAAASANCKTLTSLSQFYVNFRRTQNPLGHSLKKAVNSLVAEIERNIHDMELHDSHLLMLSSILRDSINQIREHLHMQTTERQEAISRKQEELAQRQEVVSKSMWEQTLRSSQEASTMRIITIITLVYLPPTFVSTFFSTDIVKYQNGESYSALALGRWWSVTGPLMGATLIIVGAWFTVESRWRKKEKKQLQARYPGVFPTI
ncbi:hypothetical protein V2G26_019990 [Clonostachys chloroleuca]